MLRSCTVCLHEEKEKQGNTRQPRQGEAARCREVKGPQTRTYPIPGHYELVQLLAPLPAGEGEGEGLYPTPRTWIDAAGYRGHPLVRDQSCLVASAAPSAKAWSLAHMME